MLYPFYFDSTYILIIIGAILCLLASAKVRSTYSRYQRVRSASGLTGREAAERILYYSGIQDVRVEHVAGNLTDHYDPRSKVLRLSDTTYGSPSVAAVGVAAHECGHAIQHARGYAPLSFRSALVPLANFGSTIAWPLIILGFLFNNQSSQLFINIGILAFSLAVLFQMTFVGMPTVFYGDELGMTGLEELNFRAPMVWDGGDRELAEFFRRLAALRTRFPALRRGNFRDRKSVV